MDSSTYPNRKSVSVVIIITWLVSTVVAFWWFQFKDLREFDTQMSILIEEQPLVERLRELLVKLNEKPERGYILNFWQPHCSCSRFNIPHILELKQTYEKQGFKLVTITHSSEEMADKDLQNLAEKQFNSPVVIADARLFKGSTRIPAMPSAAVLSHSGELNYFGPYNDGAFCGIGGTRFIEKVADLMIGNNAPNIINTLAFGCYCSWV